MRIVVNMVVVVMVPIVVGDMCLPVMPSFGKTVSYKIPAVKDGQGRDCFLHSDVCFPGATCDLRSLC